MDDRDSNDTQCAESASRDRAPHGGTRIVVGLDEGPASAAALTWAAEQSRLTGAPLLVVHAWDLGVFGEAALVSGAGDLWATACADARARATRWVQDTLGRGAGAGAGAVRWSLEVPEGSPGPVLVASSADARLLVLGTQEHTGLLRMVTGSTSHYCLSHARVPVVAVPAVAAPEVGTTSDPSSKVDEELVGAGQSRSS